MRFSIGVFDQEMQRSTQPALLGPNFSWIRAHAQALAAKDQAEESEKLRQEALVAIEAVETTHDAAADMHEEAKQEATETILKAFLHKLPDAVRETTEKLDQMKGQHDELAASWRSRAAREHFVLLESSRVYQTRDSIAQRVVPALGLCQGRCPMHHLVRLEHDFPKRVASIDATSDALRPPYCVRSA